MSGVKKKPAPESPHREAGAKWNLTRRETEVLGIMCKGVTDKDIARSLGISRSTVSKHVEHILAKMGVSNRTAAANRSLRG